MVDNHEENTIQNQFKLFRLYSNQECFFKSPWASIWVIHQIEAHGLQIWGGGGLIFRDSQ